MNFICAYLENSITLLKRQQKLRNDNGTHLQCKCVAHNIKEKKKKLKKTFFHLIGKKAISALLPQTLIAAPHMTCNAAMIMVAAQRVAVDIDESCNAILARSFVDAVAAPTFSQQAPATATSALCKPAITLQSHYVQHIVDVGEIHLLAL